MDFVVIFQVANFSGNLVRTAFLGKQVKISEENNAA